MKRDIKFISKKQNKTNFIDDNISLAYETRIEMFSNKEVIVDGCLGVLEFCDTYIKLKLTKGNVLVYGDNLLINGFEEKTLTVSGNVSTVEFCIREKIAND